MVFLYPRRRQSKSLRSHDRSPQAHKGLGHKPVHLVPVYLSIPRIQNDVVKRSVDGNEGVKIPPWEKNRDTFPNVGR